MKMGRKRKEITEETQKHGPGRKAKKQGPPELIGKAKGKKSVLAPC